MLHLACLEWVLALTKFLGGMDIQSMMAGMGGGGDMEAMVNMDGLISCLDEEYGWNGCRRNEQAYSRQR